MPCLQLELHGEIAGKSCGFVLIELKDLHLGFSNADPPFTTVSITLQSFFIEDLLHPTKDKFRYLMTSTNAVQTLSAPSLNMKHERPSSSFPSDRSLYRVDLLSTSLPNIANSEDWFDIHNKEMEGEDCRSGYGYGQQQLGENPLISVKIVTTSDSSMETEMMDSTQVNCWLFVLVLLKKMFKCLFLSRSTNGFIPGKIK